MTCGYKAIRETFTSRVTLLEAENRILVEYIDGPFSHLHNQWRFEPAPQSYAPGGSAVHFHIDYAFKIPMLGMLVGAMFDRAFRKLSCSRLSPGQPKFIGQDRYAATPATA